MTDFRKYNPHIDKHQLIRGLNKRLLLISALGLPFILCLGFAIPAYFGNDAVFPFLENRQHALWLLVLGAAGLLLETVSAMHTISRINTLKQDLEKEGRENS